MVSLYLSLSHMERQFITRRETFPALLLLFKAPPLHDDFPSYLIGQILVKRPLQLGKKNFFFFFFLKRIAWTRSITGNEESITMPGAQLYGKGQEWIIRDSTSQERWGQVRNRYGSWSAAVVMPLAYAKSSIMFPEWGKGTSKSRQLPKVKQQNRCGQVFNTILWVWSLRLKSNHLK